MRYNGLKVGMFKIQTMIRNQIAYFFLNLMDFVLYFFPIRIDLCLSSSKVYMTKVDLHQ